jgi:CBS domain-containing protein
MKAADVMSRDVKAISLDATIADAVRLMLNNGFSGLPVVDAQDQLVGIITEGDLLRRAQLGTERQRPHWIEFLLGPGKLAEDYVESHARRVDEFMTPDVASVDENAEIGEVVSLMERRGIKHVPVTHGNRLIGLICRANLLRALARAWAKQPPKATRDDATLRARILEALGQERCVSTACIDVLVLNGVVLLKGVITDERERLALHVLVENFPDVKGIKDHIYCVEPMSGMVSNSPV